MIPLIKELKAPVKTNKKKPDPVADDPEEKEELEIEVRTIFMGQYVVLYVTALYCISLCCIKRSLCHICQCFTLYTVL